MSFVSVIGSWMLFSSGAPRLCTGCLQCLIRVCNLIPSNPSLRFMFACNFGTGERLLPHEPSSLMSPIYICVAQDGIRRPEGPTIIIKSQIFPRFDSSVFCFWCDHQSYSILELARTMDKNFVPPSGIQRLSHGSWKRSYPPVGLARMQRLT